jgi:hypothetical protein
MMFQKKQDHAQEYLAMELLVLNEPLKHFNDCVELDLFNHEILKKS